MVKRKNSACHICTIYRYEILATTTARVSVRYSVNGMYERNKQMPLETEKLSSIDIVSLKKTIN